MQEFAAGPGKRLQNGTTVPMDLQVGNCILLGKYSGTETQVDGDEYITMRED